MPETPEVPQPPPRQQPEPRPEPRTEPRLHALDARSLRGLAHPLRMRMLAELRHEGPATASRLAQRLGESSGATSYHLRQLAAHGFVEDAPEQGKGRERWWRAVHDGLRFDESLLYDDDSATRGAAGLFLHEVATIHAQEVGTWLGNADTLPAEWRHASDLSDFTLHLTAEESLDLIHKMHDLVNGFRDLPPTEGRIPVRVHTHAFPRNGADTPRHAS
ncbi:ArsR/SmtB family transcription factor [Streptomyces sp. NPDC058279]|uniref:ArsR/SmtB family transcription factor n=1 Tax=Streptomyces sp. NPDC058279 TaxID=3346418 RepID=UPI0036ED673E